MIYLDHNATTPLDERVLEAMSPYLTTFFGNPSSLYRAGRIAKSAVETARERIAQLVGVPPSQIVFTGGGTEANNLALKGLTSALPAGGVAVEASAHPSILETADSLRASGWKIHRLPVDRSGLIDCEAAVHTEGAGLRLASFMLANNETGVIQDAAYLSAVLRERGAFIHIDAVQAAGKIPVEFGACGAHTMSLSSHKLYGPKGVGALVMEKGVELRPLINGGGQEKGLRGGTENVSAIVGFGKAAELALAELEQRSRRLMTLRRRFEAALAGMTGVTIFGAGAPRLPNTVQFGIDGMDGEMLLMEFDRRGIAVSSGSACASGGGEPSHVLTAMGIDPALARSAVRVSFGMANTEAEVDRFVEILRDLLPASA